MCRRAGGAWRPGSRDAVDRAHPLVHLKAAGLDPAAALLGGVEQRVGLECLRNALAAPRGQNPGEPTPQRDRLALDTLQKASADILFAPFGIKISVRQGVEAGDEAFPPPVERDRLLPQHGRWLASAARHVASVGLAHSLRVFYRFPFQRGLSTFTPSGWVCIL